MRSRIQGKSVYAERQYLLRLGLVAHVLASTAIMTVFEEHEFAFDEGKKTYYVAAGPTDGPLLIFIHGWPAIAKLWKPQLETFASLGFRVVSPDMPGTSRENSCTPDSMLTHN